MLLPVEKEFQALLNTCFQQLGEFHIHWNDHKSCYDSLDKTLANDFPNIDATVAEDITKNDSLWTISGDPYIASSTLVGVFEQIANVSEPLRQTIEQWEDLIKRINHKEYSSFAMEVQSATDQGFNTDITFQVFPSSGISISDGSEVWTVANLLDSTRGVAICEKVMDLEELDNLPSVVQKRVANWLVDSPARDKADVKAWLSKKDISQHVTIPEFSSAPPKM